MGKVLGLDLGTSSLGWAIVEKDENGTSLLDKGVCIFQEGVAREKGNEKPAVRARTQARASRRHYFRRRLRKIELLKVLVREQLCPPLADTQLLQWRKKKIYPMNEAFIYWQRTDDHADKNPYADRYRALTEKLDLSKQEDRYVLGRAFYHLVQRRGFLSNRKDTTNENETGQVKSQIKGLTQDMQKANCRYLGEYFYKLYQQKEKIRQHYTSRVEHYEAEFNAICQQQDLSESLRKALYDAIFYQRPLKSQKGLVGKCTFEKNKSRCPVSHPSFEEFRMLSFINNIRVTILDEADKRPLTIEEIDKIRPLFFRKSKSYFDFDDIAKKIAGKNPYACKGDNQADTVYRFNYSKETTVSGCPVTTGLKTVFGENYLSEICSLYLLGKGKNENQIINDVWHVLFSFDNDDKLTTWAKENLQLSDEDAQKFADIPVPRDYAALSLNAINKILPFLRKGMRYDEAVFVANLRGVLPGMIYTDASKREKIENDIITVISEFWSNPLNKETTKEKLVRDYLQDNFPEIDGRHLDHLYHPSMIETYPDAQPNADNIYQLGSPRTSAIRNPMAMRALFRLRALVNQLLREKKIDKDTKIRIEFARGLNDANRRKAIERYQREREAENQKYIKELQKYEESGKNIDPTEEDILKYRLWEEQKHRCLYTGEQINISDFIGLSSKFDIEHTIPRSMGGDDSLMNKTLCENHFNRDIKKGKLPSQLSNHAEILSRIETLGWQDKKCNLKKQIEANVKKSKMASTKDEKDKAIIERHYLKLKYDYWDGKLKRFNMDKAPEGFANRQGVDIGIIGKYAKMYLRTVFNHIEAVKGATTADFRKMWGLQDEYTKKERNNHVHHCIDAITIACIGRNEYDNWARYMADEERYERGESGKPSFPKPWPTFTEDVKAIADEVLVSHHTPDNMSKQSRKKWRVRGKIKCDTNHNPIYVQGDAARAVLHQQTFYGAIERDGEIRYVVRKTLDQLKDGDIKNIVDEIVRQKVEKAIKDYGKDALLDSEKYPIWMNEEKRIPIRKVRIYTPTITQPINLKQHRDKSIKDYKRYYHVANEGNYCMAIYEGTDNKGKLKRSFKIVSNIEAVRYFKASTDKKLQMDLVPHSDEVGNPLKCILKTGTMVLFYEKTPQELRECSQQDLVKRLYKVSGMSTLVVQKKYAYGALSFKHHLEARPAGELKVKNGQWKIGEEYRPIIGMNHTQLQAYIEGYDFDLTVDGKIEFKY